MTETTMLTAIVYGTPVQQGSMVGGRYGGVHASNDKTLRPWRKNVKGVLEQAIIDQHWLTMMDAPHGMRVVFYMPRPKTVTREVPTVPPDLDKLIRAIGDASTDAKVVHDDSRYVEIQARKFYAYPGEERVEIDIWRFE